MAREYARIRLSIAEDEDFEDLTPAAQWLYLRVLLPDPSLNYAGVCDWRPNRLLGKAKGIDMGYLLSAAAELEQKRYVLFDNATEEALIRTYIRGDELMRNPKMALAVVGGYQATASKPLRACIVTEVLKDREEHPEYSSWEHEISRAEVSRLLTRKGSDSVPYTNQIEVPITNRITNPDQGADYQSDSVHIPSHLTPNTYPPDTYHPHQLETPSPERLPTRTNNGAEIVRNRIANLPTASVAAHRIAQAFSDSLPVPIESGVLAEIGTQSDKCLRDGIPPAAIAEGIRDWVLSNSWHPSQIPKFVAKAAARAAAKPSGVGKATRKALDYDAACDELIAELETSA